jgi:probable F420-dependent oxidoreductase
MTSFGLLMFPTAYSIAPDDFAREAEERGFESIWFTDHTHIPASRRTPYPLGGELPREYYSNLDQFVALAAAASVTRTIKLGTGICLVNERDPIVTAKQVATLDVISNGRVVFGIGAGWNAEELETHGVAWRERWAVAREHVLAMKEIWRHDEASFHGRYVNFDRIWSFPKPVQPGGPPVIIGAFGGDAVFERIAEYGDGWMPLHGVVPDGGVQKLTAALEKVGRRREDVTITITSAFAAEDYARPAVDAGFERVTFYVTSDSRQAAIEAMDGYAKVMAALTR